MGLTYKARETRLGRVVVLKVISSGLLQGEEEARRLARERFLREARALALLQHSAIPILYDFGEEAGEDYYAMEFIAGEDLDKRIKRAGALPISEALHLAEQAARALSAAHHAGILHRDVKPSNLMLVRGEDGRESVKLIDFGLAKGAEGGADLGWSSGGDIRYTPLFASPEQCRQEPATERSDLYSLGVTLWFMLTGKPPFGGTSVYEVQNKHNVAPPPLEKLPEALPPRARELVARLLAKHADERPHSADAVVRELAALQHELAHPAAALLSAGEQTLGGAETLRAPLPAPPPARETPTMASAETLRSPAPVLPPPPAPVLPPPPPAAPVAVAPLPAAPRADEAGRGLDWRVAVFGGLTALLLGGWVARQGWLKAPERSRPSAGQAATPTPAAARVPVRPLDRPNVDRPREAPVRTEPRQSAPLRRPELMAALERLPSRSRETNGAVIEFLRNARSLGCILIIPFSANQDRLVETDVAYVLSALEDPNIQRLRADPALSLVFLSWADAGMETAAGAGLARRRGDFLRDLCRTRGGVTQEMITLPMGTPEPDTDKDRKVEVWAVFR